MENLDKVLVANQIEHLLSQINTADEVFILLLENSGFVPLERSKAIALRNVIMDLNKLVKNLRSL